MRKKSKVFIFMLVLAFALSGCKKDTVKEEKNPVPIEKVEKIQKKEEVPTNINLLTGLADMTEQGMGKRPVAVMVNNIESAMPQYGVEKADIIFEIPVEGDFTRFMALYGDYTQVPKVCAIRSCRYYFPTFSEGYDAFYVNWGVDETIRGYLNSLNLDQFDGMSFGDGLFGRDQSRLDAGYAMEHTAYFDGTKFAAVVDNGYRTQLSEEHNRPAFKFVNFEEEIKPQGEECTQVHIDFGGQTSTFVYDAENKLYKKQLNGQPQIDVSTGNQFGFTNLFVMESAISVRDDVGHKDIECMGGDSTVAYYISNGAVQRVHWKKDGGQATSKLIFFDDNGEEIPVNRGKSYIAISYPGKEKFK